MRGLTCVVFWILCLAAFAQDGEPEVDEGGHFEPESARSVPAPLMALEEDLPLPEWDEEELTDLEAGDYVPGSSLLGLIALEHLYSDNDEVIELDPSIRDLPDVFVEAEEWPTVIGDQFLPAYFSDPPKHYLNDPQKLLTTQEYRDRESFLEYHAQDTDIDLYIYLFDARQELPEGVTIEKIMTEHPMNEASAALVFYFLEAPERSQLAFSKTVRESIPLEEREKVLRMAVEEGMEKSEASSQLESFSIQLSIRLYWMERVVAKAGGAGVNLTTLNLSEMAITPRKKLGFIDKLRQNSIVYYSLISVGVLIPVIVFGLLGRRLAESKKVYVFPDAQGDALLEAPHAAGVGGVVSYASATLPPASQREDVPDYLQKM